LARDPLKAERCAELLAALAAPERLRIVRVLVGGARPVGEIAKCAGVRLANVAHHLTMLKAAGLVSAERRGRFVWYALVAELHEPAACDATVEVFHLGGCRLLLPCCRL